MPTAYTFPSDPAMLAAFESVLDQLDTERRQADAKDKAELAYWRNQHNSFAKAFAHWRRGVRPDYTGESYLISSASRPIVHRVRLLGGVWLCSCEATALCWHAAMVATVERAIDLLEQGLIGECDPTDGPPAIDEVDGPADPDPAPGRAVDVRALAARLAKARDAVYAAV